jgi:hypothetical protein
MTQSARGLSRPPGIKQVMLIKLDETPMRLPSPEEDDSAAEKVKN